MAIRVPFLLVISQIFLVFTLFSSAADNITQSQSLADGSTLVSKDGIFELGFFSPGTSSNGYLGIWYKNIPVRTVVWVANRENPITTVKSSLSIRDGNLLILSDSKSVIWSTDSTKRVINPILLLLDSGNLVIREMDDGNPQNYSWQSFDYPTDTLLPEMKLGWKLKTGLNSRLSTWNNSEVETGPSGNPEMAMWRGSEKLYRDGPLNVIHSNDSFLLIQNPVLNCEFVNSEDEFYYKCTLKNKSQIARLALDRISYSRQLYVWAEEKIFWEIYTSLPSDQCDRYNACGKNGICSINESPMCQCLKGFKIKSSWNWSGSNWTVGCVRGGSWRCKEKNRDDFVKVSGMKVPDSTNSWVEESLTLEQCRAICWGDCSCTAYANSDIRGEGSGCTVWFGDHIDLRQIQDAAGQDLYIRLDPSEIDAKDDHKRKVAVISITTAVSLILVMISTFSFIYWRKRQLRDKNDEVEREDLELPLFDFDTIAHATNNFSSDNKLGQGGFGPVYKGTLIGGQEIAVKKLSKKSEQGLEEFRNEVILCAKLQHRNLVKVLGCCIQRNEKLLIYEYMHNRSLDWFLFARMFGGDEIEGNIRRVVGTYGYMAPEYVIDGLFSIKSDVFSFGILLLEIISGKKNKGLSYTNHGLTLIGHAWRLWNEDIPLKFLDPCLKDSCIVSEVLRCIRIGLLCVQQHPHDRPNMASVVVMLNNESTFPLPKEPGFFLQNTSAEDRLSSRMQMPFSTNEITVSQLEPR